MDITKENNGFSMKIDTERDAELMIEREYIKELMEEEESKLYDFKSNESNDDFFGDDDYKKLLNECGLKTENTLIELAKKEENENSASIIDYKKLISKMTDISDGQKLVFKQLVRKGEGLKVPESALVVYHYKFFHEQSTDPFDSTGIKGRPDRQRVGVGQLLCGLDVAIQSMCRKERAIFVMDSSLMFGDLGVPPRIPGKSDIYAMIDIVDFTEKNLIDDFFEKTSEERQNYTFKELIMLVSQCRDDANTAYRNQRYGIALSKYIRGLDILYAIHVADDDEEKERWRQVGKFQLNMAQCNLKLSRGPAAIKCCNSVLKDNPRHIKALYRKAKGLMIIGDYDEASRCLRMANKQSPNDVDIIDAMKQNEDMKVQYYQSEKALARLMLKAPEETGFSSSRHVESMPDLDCHIAKVFRSQLNEFLDMPDKRCLPKLKALSSDEIDILCALCREYKLDIQDKDGIIIKKR